MKVSAQPSFIRDTKKAPLPIQTELPAVFDCFRNAGSLIEIPKVKKLKGAVNAYRIRVGDYRLGFFLEDDTVVLSRLLPRKDIYRHFP